MNCPYCKKMIYAFTGLQELQKFQRHLGKCRKNPNNMSLSDGTKTATTPLRYQGFREALEIRAESGQ